MNLEKHQIDYLLVIRGLSCLLVFVSHIPVPDKSLWFLYVDGHFAVRLFLVLSGCLMAISFIEKRYVLDLTGIIFFYKNRIRRIVPVYIAISLFILIFTQYKSLWLTPEGLYKILSIFTFTFAQNQIPFFTSSWWSTSLEIQFYLIVPFVFYSFNKLLNSKTKIVSMLFIVIIIGIIFRTLYSNNILNTQEQVKVFLENIDSCIVGLISGFYLKKVSLRISSIYKRSLAFILLFISILVTSYLKYSSEVLYQRVLIFNIFNQAIQNIFCSIIIILLYQNYRQKSFNISFKRILSLENLGIISFSFYLWHSDVLSKLQSYIPIINIQSYLLIFFCSIIFTSFLSIVTWYTFERKVHA